MPKTNTPQPAQRAEHGSTSRRLKAALLAWPERTRPNTRRAVSSARRRRVSDRRASFFGSPLWFVMPLALLVGFTFAPQARAQKLPSADKVVADYLKAVGGKKRVASVRDAAYEWEASAPGREPSPARTYLKAPASARTEVAQSGVETVNGTNGRSVWTRDSEGRIQTLTDAEAHAAKLQAALEAGRFVEYKKRGVLARTVASEREGAGEPAYVVEFSTREGARLRFWFGVETKLLLKVSDETRGLVVVYGDYRAPSAGARLEPHRVEVRSKGADAPLVLALRGARYNTGLADTLFDPPAADTALNVPALLRELTRNQAAVDQRVNEYTYTRKSVERKINDRGEVTEEKTRVHEVYPVHGYGRVYKLVAEDGVPLSPERAAKEERRAAEQLEKAEREASKRLAEWERRRAAEWERKSAAERERQTEREVARAKGEGAPEGEEEEDEQANRRGRNVTIAAFLRACEFVSPRRENFRGREAVVFDFRPKPGFRPANRVESIVAKLVGVAWIDPVEKQIIRLEARFAEAFKAFGGMASLRPGAAFVFEQTRVADGVWLPRFTQVNA
ncbi:MAG TPA: hypothetical protein VGV38_03880, partial [Pyrinomonadaceae bacterium]|nr:hypothetical protein [Pyrinomonadaceae bacterium]